MKHFIVILSVICISLICSNYTFAQIPNASSKDSIQLKVESYILANKNDKAIDIALSELKKWNKTSDYKKVIYWNHSVGKILRNSQNFKKATHYLQQAKEVSFKANDSLLMAKSIFEIASLCLLEYSTKAYEKQRYDLLLTKRDSAFLFFNTLIKEYKHLNGLEITLAKTYANLTGLYSYLQDFSSAEKSAYKAKEFYQKAE